MAVDVVRDQPDIVLVMSDEHAPHFSEPYGHRIVRTPNMARLAAEGLTFDAAYCASPICVPSRAAFMTGRYPSSIEVWDNGTPLRSDVPTLAHALRHQGYDTILIGKMHFIGADQEHGFSRRLVDDSRVCGTWIDTVDWDEPDTPLPHARKRLSRAGPGRTAHIAQDEDVLAATLALLAGLPPRAARKPLFLVASFNAPHFPLVAPEHFDSYWPDNVDMPQVTGPEIAAQHPFHHRLRSCFDLQDVSGTETKRGRAAFYALCTWFDTLLGQVLDAIDSTDGLDDATTLTGYISDHGDMAGEHGLWWKCCFFEHSVRVPMILRWPGRISPGTRSGTPVSLVDLSVTLDRIGAQGMKSHFSDMADGGDLRQILSGEENPERPVISEYCAHAAGRPIRMIRQGRWKFVHYHGEASELYDLTADPEEKHNLAGQDDVVDIEGLLEERVLAGWVPAEIDRRVRRSQMDRKLIADVAGLGRFE